MNALNSRARGRTQSEESMITFRKNLAIQMMECHKPLKLVRILTLKLKSRNNVKIVEGKIMSLFLLLKMMLHFTACAEVRNSISFWI